MNIPAYNVVTRVEPDQKDRGGQTDLAPLYVLLEKTNVTFHDWTTRQYLRGSVRFLILSPCHGLPVTHLELCRDPWLPD